MCRALGAKDAHPAGWPEPPTGTAAGRWVPPAEAKPDCPKPGGRGARPLSQGCPILGGGESASAWLASQRGCRGCRDPGDQGWQEVQWREMLCCAWPRAQPCPQDPWVLPVRPPCHAGGRARGSGHHRPRRRLSLPPAVPAALTPRGPLSPAEGRPPLAAWPAWQVLVGEAGPGSANSASLGATDGVQGSTFAQHFLLKRHALVLPRMPARRPRAPPAPVGELSFCRWEGTSSQP